MIVAVRDPYPLVSSGKDWWAVDVAGKPPKGWKAMGATGWVQPREAYFIDDWCKKNIASPYDIFGGQALFESYDDATLFYLTFVQ